MLDGLALVKLVLQVETRHSPSSDAIKSNQAVGKKSRHLRRKF